MIRALYYPKSISIKCKVLIFIIIFALLFLGNFFIAGITVRNIVAFGLLGYSLLNFRKIHLSKQVISYFMFLFILLTCEALSGSLFSTPGIKTLTYYFVAISVILSFPIIFKDFWRIHFAFQVTLFLYLFNCIITILQFFNLEISWTIGSLINPKASLYYEFITDTYGADANFLSHSIITGLLGFVVTNGCFTASVLPLVTCRLWGNNTKQKIYSYIFLGLAIYALFCIQQRMGFLIGLTYLAIVLIFSLKKGGRIILSIAIIFSLLIFGDFWNNIDLGRLTSTEDTYRTHIFSLFEDLFNTDYWLIGGFDLSNEYIQKVLGHNSFMDSFRRGGLISMVFYTVLVLIIAIYCIRNIKYGFKRGSLMLIGFFLSSLFYIAYSLTHSAGIQSGYPEFWTIFSLGVALTKVYDKLPIIAIYR